MLLHAPVAVPAVSAARNGELRKVESKESERLSLARSSEATAGDTAMAPRRRRRLCPAVGFLFLAKFCPTPSLLLPGPRSLRGPTVSARLERSL